MNDLAKLLSVAAIIVTAAIQVAETMKPRNT
jgi:hypothetical protein